VKSERRRVMSERRRERNDKPGRTKEAEGGKVGITAERMERQCKELETGEGDGRGR
jgi:hypothetical protein